MKPTDLIDGEGFALGNTIKSKREVRGLGVGGRKGNQSSLEEMSKVYEAATITCHVDVSRFVFIMTYDS